MNNSIHGNIKNRRIDKNNFIHFFGNDATIFRNNKKYTLGTNYCESCQRNTKHKIVNTKICFFDYTCLHCEESMTINI